LGITLTLTGGASVALRVAVVVDAEWINVLRGGSGAVLVAVFSDRVLTDFGLGW